MSANAIAGIDLLAHCLPVRMKDVDQNRFDPSSLRDLLWTKLRFPNSSFYRLRGLILCGKDLGTLHFRNHSPIVG
jgi:hypothetical protein